MDTSQIIDENDLSQVVEKPVTNHMATTSVHERRLIYNAGYNDGLADGFNYGYYAGTLIFGGAFMVTYGILRYLERRR